MPSEEINRRDLLKYGGLGILVLALPGWRTPAFGAQAAIPEIKGNSNYARGQWFFDPTGLYIERGQTVRWVGTKWGITVTAFHPSNENHELRIPENAKPFDSGLLAEGGWENTFEWTFEAEGTYDYYSRNHEILGMVGRIVVGRPGGPAEKPPGYGGREGRAVVYPAQAKILSMVPSQQITDKKVVPFPADAVVRNYPFGE